MEPCPRIANLQLDTRSKEGVERIREIKQITNFLSLSTALNPLASIFSKPIEASYNIGTYDWDLWSMALRGIPNILQERVRQEAGEQFIDHLHEPKQKRFWAAIHEGCRVQELLPSSRQPDSPARSSNASSPLGASDSGEVQPTQPYRFVVTKATSELQARIGDEWQGIQAMPNGMAPPGIYYTGRVVERLPSNDTPNVGPLLGEAGGFVYQLLLPERQLARYPAADLPYDASQSLGAVRVAYESASVSVAALDQEQTQRLARGQSRSMT